MGLGRLAKAVAVRVGVADAIDVGRAAVGILRAVAWSGRDVSVWEVRVSRHVAIFGVLVSADATATFGWWSAGLFMGGFWRRVIGRWRCDERSGCGLRATG